MKSFSMVVVVAYLLGSASMADAAPTTPACLAKKLDAWGKLRACQATANAKALRAKPANTTACATQHAARLARLSAQAGSAAVGCRYGVNGDGTVTDYDTGLQWERKTDDGTVHDFGNDYTWSPNDGPPDGTAFTTFLGTLNDGRSADGTTSTGCFADRCDWRLPTIVELRTIVDPTAPGCGDGGPCIDQTVFGPTVPSFYWSATSETEFHIFAWGVAFGADGRVVSALKQAPLFVRAVRAAF